MIDASNSDNLNNDFNTNIDNWCWSSTDKSNECIVSPDGREVLIHPRCSEGSDCIRGNKPLPRDGRHYYWEVTIFHKIYGTAVMVGICNRNQPLAGMFHSLIGRDENGWCLTHKGDIWHNREHYRYTDGFGDKGDQTIGVLYDSAHGTLTFYRNNKCLGQAFDNLHTTNEDLYPIIGSTSLLTRIRLVSAYRYLPSLKERCRHVAYHQVFRKLNDLNEIQLPTILLQYINELSPYFVDCKELRKRNHYDDIYMPSESDEEKFKKLVTEIMDATNRFLHHQFDSNEQATI